MIYPRRMSASSASNVSSASSSERPHHHHHKKYNIMNPNHYLSLSSYVSSALSSVANHIQVDLASPQVDQALESLQKIRCLRKRVRSATVHANSLLTSFTTSGSAVETLGSSSRNSDFGASGSRLDWNVNHLEHTLAALGSLPHLTSLTICLNYRANMLPVAALLPLFQQTKKNFKALKTLTFQQVTLVGTESELKQFQKCLQQYQSSPIKIKRHHATGTSSRTRGLESLTLKACRGASAIRVLLEHLPHLRDLQLVHTCIVHHQEPVTVARQVVTLHPYLQSLRLEDIPDLTDDPCVAIVEAITLMASRTRTQTRLQEFHCISDALTDRSAQAIADMMTPANSKTNTSALRQATIQLDCEESDWATRLPQILQHNSTLESLYVGLYNSEDTITEQQLVDMASAVAASAGNSRLQRLHIRLEMDMEQLPLVVLQAWETALEAHAQLQVLSLEDGSQAHPLTARARYLLHMNQCGIQSLYSQALPPNAEDMVETLIRTVEHSFATVPATKPASGITSASSSSASDYSTASTDEDATPVDDPTASMERLDAIFHLLSHTPELIHLALDHDNIHTTTPNPQKAATPQNSHYRVHRYLAKAWKTTIKPTITKWGKSGSTTTRSRTSSKKVLPLSPKRQHRHHKQHHHQNHHRDQLENLYATDSVIRYTAN